MISSFSTMARAAIVTSAEFDHRSRLRSSSTEAAACRARPAKRKRGASFSLGVREKDRAAVVAFDSGVYWSRILLMISALAAPQADGSRRTSIFDAI
jgi:hypothetical protein